MKEQQQEQEKVYYLAARNPYIQSNGDITLEVEWADAPGRYGWFTASPNDSTVYGPELYRRALAGEFGEVEDRREQERAQHEAQEKIAALRTQLADIERQIVPLRDEALVGIITDEGRALFIRLIGQRRQVQAELDALLAKDSTAETAE